MYEENEKKIEWGGIIKKILILLAALLVIFGIITLINKCSKDDEQEPIDNTPISLDEQLDKLESATLEYLTIDNLPTEINASKTVRLKILINNNLVTEITDSEGNTCDANESYSEVTRLENNYAVKVSVTCGNDSAYRIIYVGCFENCKDGKICKGSENSTGGVCTISTPDTDETPATDTDSNNKTNTGTSNNTSKPSTSSKPTTTTKPSTNDKNNSTNNNNTTSTTKKETLYEYQKCSTENICAAGQLNANGDCEVYKHVTLIGKVIKYDNPVYFNSPTKAKNTSTVTYKFEKYVVGKGYEYSILPSCEDKSYTYTESTDKCTKVELQAFYEKPTTETSCQVTWSYSPSLPGWTRTGKTK